MTDALRIIPTEVMKSLSKSELVTLLEGEQEIRSCLQAEIDRLKSLQTDLQDQVLQINGKYIRLKNKIFDRSSEKSPKKPNSHQETTKPEKSKKKRIREEKHLKNCRKNTLTSLLWSKPYPLTKMSNALVARP